MDAGVFCGYPTHIENVSGLLKISLQKDRKLGLFVESFLQENLKELKSSRFIPTKEDLVPGTIGIAQFDDSQYYRIQILEQVPSNLVSVRSIDYGRVATLPLFDIRLLHYEVFKTLLNIPALSITGYLENVLVSKPWSEDEFETLKSLVLFKEQHCILRQLHPKVKVVNIYFHNDGSKNLTKLILENELGSAISDSDLVDAVKSMSRRLGSEDRLLSQSLSKSFGHRSLLSDETPERILPLGRQSTFNFSSSHMLPVGSSHNAYISHITDGPYSFSLQLKSSAEDALPRLTRLLRQHEPVPNTRPLLPGTMVMTRFPSEGSFRRSIVMDVKSNMCQVYHTDYGSSEEVPFSEIYELPSQAHHAPAMALRFCLADLKNTPITESSKAQFQDLLLGHQVLVRVVKQESEGPLLQYCEMFYEGRNVKDILLSFNAPVEFTIQQPPRGKDIKVTISHAESPTVFFIQYSSKLDLIDVIQESLNCYCKHQPRLKDLSTVSIGSPVAALFEDNIWYRAMVLSLGTDSAQVSYVDYGNASEVFTSQLCLISRDLVTKWRTQAVECCLIGFENENASEDQILKMEESISHVFYMNPIKILSTNRFLVELIDESGNRFSDQLKATKHQSSFADSRQSSMPMDTSKDLDYNQPDGHQKAKHSDNMFVRPAVRKIIEHHGKFSQEEEQDKSFPNDTPKSNNRQSSYDKPQRFSKTQESNRSPRDGFEKPAEEWDENTSLTSHTTNESFSKGRFSKSTPNDDNRKGNFKNDSATDSWNTSKPKSNFNDKSKFGNKSDGRRSRQSDASDESWSESGGSRFGDKKPDDSGRFGKKFGRDDEGSGGRYGGGGGGRRSGDFGGGRREDRFGSGKQDDDRFGSDKPGDNDTPGKFRSGGRFGGGRRDNDESGGRFGGGRRDNDESGGRFGGGWKDNEESGGRFGGGRRGNEEGGGRFGGGRRDNDESGGRFGGGRRDNDESGGRFGGGRRDNDESGGRFGGGRRDNDESGGRFGGGRRGNDDSGGRFGGGWKDNEESGGRFGGGRRGNEEGGGRFGGGKRDGGGGWKDDGGERGGGRFSGSGRFGGGRENRGRFSGGDSWADKKKDGDGFHKKKFDSSFGSKPASGGGGGGMSTAVEEWCDEETVSTAGGSSLTVSAFFPVETISPNSRLQVVVSSVSHPHQTYVQKVGCEPDLDQMRNSIDQLATDLKPIKEDSIDPGTPVLAKFSEDEALYRGLVRQYLPPKQAKILFVDYGNFEVVGFQDLYHIPPELLNKPLLAYHCSLKNIRPVNENWSDTPTTYDACLNGEEELTLDVQSVRMVDGLMVLEGTLTDSSGVSVSQKLVDSGLALPSQASGAAITETVVEKVELPSTELPTIPISTDLPVEKWVDRFHLLEKQVMYGKILELVDSRTFALRLIDAKVVAVACLSDHQADDVIAPGALVIAEIENVLEDKLRVSLFDLNGKEILPFVDETRAPRTVSPICKYPVVRRVDNVSITHLEQPSVYIQRLAETERIAEFLDEIYNFYCESSPEERDWEVGTLCAGRSLADDNWYRAVVISSDEKYKVRFLDYGNIEVLPTENLRLLDPQFYFSELVLDVSLPVNWKSTDPSPLLDVVVGEHYKSVVTRDLKGNWLTDLTTFNGVKLIDTLLEKNAIDSVSENPFDEVNLEIGSSLVSGDKVPVIVSHADSPTMFYVQLQRHVDVVNTLQAKLQESIENAEKAFSSDLIFAAKFAADDMWYRATKVNSESLRFIDYGNSDTITDDIKKLPDDLIKPVSGYAIPVYLCASPVGENWSEEAVEVFLEFIERENIIGEVVSVDYKVVIDLIDGDVQLSKVLIDAGHAVYCDHKPEVLKKYLSDDFSDSFAERLFKSISQKKDLIVKNQEKSDASLIKVFISHINSLNDFYVQEEEKSDSIHDVANRLLELNQEISSSDVEIGKVYAANFSDGCWYRAKVLSKEPEVSVMFVDFGNTCTATNFQILTDDLESLEPLLIHCCLDVEESVDALVDLRRLSAGGSEPFYLKIIAEGVPNKVELYDESGSNIVSLLGISTTEIMSSEPKREKVVITHSYGPDSFYAQTEKNTPLAEEISSQLFEAGNFEVVNEIAVDDLIAAEFPDDGCWYRAAVLSCTPDVVVRFVDFGNTSVVTEYRRLPEELLHEKPLSVKCCLQLPPSSDSWPPNCVEIFNTIINDDSNDLEMLIISEGPINTVEIFCNGKSITDDLTSKILTTEAINVDKNLPSVAKASDPQNLVKGFITHINSIDNFYIQREDCADSLSLVQSALSILDENPQSKPDCGIGSIIAAKFVDGEWYRGKILQIDSEIRVRFIDYGNECNVSEISALPEELSDIPPVALKCSLNVDGKLKEDALRIFSKLCGEAETRFEFSIKSVVEDTSIVEIWLNNENVSKKLITDKSPVTSDFLEEQSNIPDNLEVANGVETNVTLQDPDLKENEACDIPEDVEICNEGEADEITKVLASGENNKDDPEEVFNNTENEPCDVQKDLGISKICNEGEADEMATKVLASGENNKDDPEDVLNNTLNVPCDVQKDVEISKICNEGESDKMNKDLASVENKDDPKEVLNNTENEPCDILLEKDVGICNEGEADEITKDLASVENKDNPEEVLTNAENEPCEIQKDVEICNESEMDEMTTKELASMETKDDPKEVGNNAENELCNIQKDVEISKICNDGETDKMTKDLASVENEDDPEEVVNNAVNEPCEIEGEAISYEDVKPTTTTSTESVLSNEGNAVECSNEADSEEVKAKINNLPSEDVKDKDEPNQVESHDNNQNCNLSQKSLKSEDKENYGQSEDFTENSIINPNETNETKNPPIENNKESLPESPALSKEDIDLKLSENPSGEQPVTSKSTTLPSPVGSTSGSPRHSMRDEKLLPGPISSGLTMDVDSNEK